MGCRLPRASRIALAVPALVVRTDDSQSLAPQESDSAEDLLAEDGVRLHQAALGIRERLGLLQDVVWDPDLADVVQEEPVDGARVLDQAGVDCARKRGRVALTRCECSRVPVSFDSSALASADTVSM